MVEPKKEVYGNPLAGSNLPDNFSILSKPIEYQGAKKFKVLQVIAKDGALAQSEDPKYKSIEFFGDPIVLLISDQNNVCYDDLVVTVVSKQRTLQLGTYRYETRMGISKTVPVVVAALRGRFWVVPGVFAPCQLGERPILTKIA